MTILLILSIPMFLMTAILFSASFVSEVPAKG
jgi:hypothetical protein